MFACKDLTPRRMCAGPEHSSSGMYKRCRENATPVQMYMSLFPT